MKRVLDRLFLPNQCYEIEYACSISFLLQFVCRLAGCVRVCVCVGGGGCSLSRSVVVARAAVALIAVCWLGVSRLADGRSAGPSDSDRSSAVRWLALLCRTVEPPTKEGLMKWPLSGGVPRDGRAEERTANDCTLKPGLRPLGDGGDGEGGSCVMSAELLTPFT